MLLIPFFIFRVATSRFNWLEKVQGGGGYVLSPSEVKVKLNISNMALVSGNEYSINLIKNFETC